MAKRTDRYRRYGLDLEDYRLLLEAQGGVCAICGGVNPNTRTLSVDHNHRTGAVRLLLCDSCNWGIGQFKEDPELLRRAASYLENFDGFIPAGLRLPH